MELIDILLSVLLVSASAFLIYLIVSLKKLNETLDNFGKDMHEITERSLPILDNLENISGKISQNIDEVDYKFQEFKDKFLSTLDKFNFLKPSDEPLDPHDRVRKFLFNLRAFSRGLTAFWENIKK